MRHKVVQEALRSLMEPIFEYEFLEGSHGFRPGRSTDYSAIDAFFPGSFLVNVTAGTDHRSELLYFNLVTLSTIGYGDSVPLHGEVRILAALEGVTGVLYVAITVALLVSAYGQKSTSGQE